MRIASFTPFDTWFFNGALLTVQYSEGSYINVIRFETSDNVDEQNSNVDVEIIKC